MKKLIFLLVAVLTVCMTSCDSSTEQKGFISQSSEEQIASGLVKTGVVIRVKLVDRGGYGANDICIMLKDGTIIYSYGISVASRKEGINSPLWINETDSIHYTCNKNGEITDVINITLKQKITNK